MEKITLTAAPFPTDVYSKSMEWEGQTIRIRDRLSRLDKEAAASELLSMAVIFDDKRGIAYDAVYADVARLFVITKYYTDIDVAPYNTPEGWYVLYDTLNDYGNILYDYIVPTEVDELMSIYCQLKITTQRMFEREHALETAIQNMMGGMLSGGAQTDAIAEASNAIELMIDALGALHNQRMASMKGGLPISFAKKK